MLSSLVIIGVLAFGAVAKPIEKRRIVTEVATETQTITVYVTAVPATETVQPSPPPEETKSREWSSEDGLTDIMSILPVTSTETPVASLTDTMSILPVTSTETPAASLSDIMSILPVSTETPAASEPTPTELPEDFPAPTVKIAEGPAPNQERPDPAPESPSSTQAAADSHPTGKVQATLYTGPGYQAAMLYHHNAARANHGAKPLVWDRDCEDGARRTADMCIFAHPDFLGDLKQGQNLFATSGNFYNATAGITESWYKGELDKYLPYVGAADIPREVFHSVGHLTQMLWKSTTKVGCVTVDCGGNMRLSDDTPTDMNKFTVCNYNEPGNFAGKYAENVKGPGQTADLGNWAD